MFKRHSHYGPHWGVLGFLTYDLPRAAVLVCDGEMKIDEATVAFQLIGLLMVQSFVVLHCSMAPSCGQEDPAVK